MILYFLTIHWFPPICSSMHPWHTVSLFTWSWECWQKAATNENVATRMNIVTYPTHNSSSWMFKHIERGQKRNISMEVWQSLLGRVFLPTLWWPGGCLCPWCDIARSWDLLKGPTDLDAAKHPQSWRVEIIAWEWKNRQSWAGWAQEISSRFHSKILGVLWWELHQALLQQHQETEKDPRITECIGKIEASNRHLKVSQFL